MIQRDIKPQNLKMRPGTHQLVRLDFGLASGIKNQPGHLSPLPSRTSFGYTLQYAPLEQIQGQGTDPRTDIYALSATLYHLLSGLAPVDALSRAAALINGDPDPLPALYTINPQVPLAISLLLHQCLALKQDERPPNVVVVRQHIQRLSPLASASTYVDKMPGQLVAVPAYTGQTFIAHQPDIPDQQHLRPLGMKASPAQERMMRQQLVQASGSSLSGTIQVQPSTMGRQTNSHSPSRTGALLGFLVITAMLGFFLILWPGMNRSSAVSILAPTALLPTPNPMSIFDTSMVQSVKPLASLPMKQSQVRAMAMTPDGQTIAMSAADGSVLVERKNTDNAAQPQAQLGRYIQEPFLALAFSPDGTLLAGGARDGYVRLWRVADGRLLHTFRKHFQSVSALAFSANGELLATASTDDTIRIWHLPDYSLKQEQGGYIEPESGLTRAARSLAFAPDGSGLFVGLENGRIELRRIADSHVIRAFGGHTGNVNSLALSQDGQHLVSGANDLRLWNVQDAKLLWKATGHTEGITSLAFSPDGQLLVSGSFDMSARIWSAADGRPLYSLATGTSVYTIGFSADGQELIAGVGDPAIRRWQLMR